MARFFIDRPIFAWVIALGIMLAGILSLRLLPIEQYPDIAPPVVQITAIYPGASAQTVEEAVTAIVEREMSGAPGLMYTSANSSSGMASITVSFEQGTDPDLAAVEVQNRLKTVEPRLPEVVRRNGVMVEKAAESISMIVTLSSEDGSWDEVELGELASATLLQTLRRIEGVGKVQQFGTESAMRIWPDPARLAAMNITATDLIATLRNYNARVTVGAIGAEGVPESAPISANIMSESHLNTPEQFGDIALRTQADGSAVRIRDVARVELGGSEYGTRSRLNGLPASGLAIRLAPGSNAVESADAVRAAMNELSKQFPSGVRYDIPFETSEFVKISIKGVIVTLLEAILLVFLVMYLFMQNFRATLIPTLVVPVALLGTMAVLLALGYTINVLAMFGMVLAIGILVDDAIVVVENVERLMQEEGLPPYEATVKAMQQISGAIIGITVVLVSVFLPMAFFSGAVGNIYRQFSVTLAVSISFSAFLALSLTPALAATLLKPIPKEHHERKGFFGWFNKMFSRATQRYTASVHRIVRRPLRWVILYLSLTAVMAFLFLRLPGSFIPEEDKGSFMIMVSKPQGTPLAETMKSLGEVQRHLLANEPVRYVYAIGGFSFFGSGPSSGMMFANLKNWDDRNDSKDSVQAIVGRVAATFAGRSDMTVLALNTPSLPGLGTSTGFDLRLQDRAGIGYQKFTAARDQLLNAARQDPAIGSAYFAGVADTPQLELEIDREKAESMGVAIGDINTTLAVMFGSDYIGDFMMNNQVRKIIVQAEGRNRLETEDVGRLYVRNREGTMVPLSAFTQLRWTVGPPQLARFNGFPSLAINGTAPPGGSSGDAMESMERLVAQLPAGLGLEWAGQSAEERESGNQAPMLYALSLLIVFLALAALYESWAIPAAVILVVPLGVLGAVLGVTLRGMPNDVYFRVGLIATIGLSAKNAILIIEVAKDLHAEGRSLIDATLEAARLRLRPILMTSLAFGFGVFPLAVARGAGSAAQNAIGTGVLGGIIVATVLAIFLVPLFFTVIGRYFNVGKRANKNQSTLRTSEATS
ncbi:multidrug efflux RND transporter permease subunit [Oligoflexus tunisiensis]|uniref:multidrug efflux RND transporter permease subunit n=1 Tax=Oligoflexus tunisiensis TaxID=708132 RepID=UPI000B10D827|nr:multidrug efflux RND transporter permease subunit [Oligoflexus tunisiensis]